MKHDKNYTPANDYWRNDDYETIELEVAFDRKHMTGYLEARRMQSLAKAVINPIKSANKRYRQSAEKGYFEPVLALYLPITNELYTAANQAPFLRHVTQACAAIVDAQEGS